MTTPSKLPASDGDCAEIEKIGNLVSDESIPSPATGSPSGQKIGSTSAGGMRRLSSIAEQVSDSRPLDTAPRSHKPREGSEWPGSGFTTRSDKLEKSRGGSHYSSDDSYLPDTGEDCAGLILACLHCRFHELMVLLPDTCERAVIRCFPSYQYIKWSSERDQQRKDHYNYRAELECNCCGGSCQDTGELLELAMEISEVCYR